MQMVALHDFSLLLATIQMIASSDPIFKGRVGVRLVSVVNKKIMRSSATYSFPNCSDFTNFSLPIPYSKITHKYTIFTRHTNMLYYTVNACVVDWGAVYILKSNSRNYAALLLTLSYVYAIIIKV